MLWRNEKYISHTDHMTDEEFIERMQYIMDSFFRGIRKRSGEITKCGKDIPMYETFHMNCSWDDRLDSILVRMEVDTKSVPAPTVEGGKNDELLSDT